MAERSALGDVASGGSDAVGGANVTGAVGAPAEAKANQIRAEVDKLNKSQPAGVRDENNYVPGVTASEAERSQDGQVARLQQQYRTNDPAIDQQFKANQSSNNEARKQYFDNITGTPQDLQNAIEARSAQAEQDLDATWANKQAADASPVVDLANAIKAGPDGKRPVVVSAVDNVVKQLYDANGNLETDPELLYGARKNLNDLLSTEAGREDPMGIRAQSSLLKLKSALDNSIEQAAPGFGQYLQNYQANSRPIDAMETLQNYSNTSKPYDSQGNMQLSRIQGMMKQIVANRTKDGVNPYQSISDDQMGRLFNLRDDLRRQQAATRLESTGGSPTAHRLVDHAKQLGSLGISTGAGIARQSCSPPATCRGVDGSRGKRWAGKVGLLV